MECFACGKSLKGSEIEHIAITVGGDSVVICDECYEKLRIFFERKVKEDAESDSRRSNERCE